MTVTKRFAAIILAGAPLFFIVSFFSAHWALFFLYNITCFAALVVDFAVTPTSKAFRVVRAEIGSMRHGAENVVTLFVGNYSNFGLLTELLDELPDARFELMSKNPIHIVPAKSQERFDYTVKPKARGLFKFNKIYLKVKSVLGLCYRFYEYSVPAETKVYPDVSDAGKHRVFAVKNRFLPEGTRRVNIKGVDAEFESLRKYVDGDDFRKINWMSTAREREIIMNQYETAKDQPVFVMLDAGRAMTRETGGGFKKLDAAISAALILCDIANQKGDNCGVITFNETIRSVIPPNRGADHRGALMDALYAVNGSNFAPNYEAAFLELASRQKHRGIVFLFTDFDTAEEAEQILETIDLIVRKHIVVIVYVKNEEAARMAKAVSFQKTDDETAKRVFEKASALNFLRERRNAAKRFSARGVLCIETEAKKFAIGAVNSYLRIKSQIS